MALVLDNGNKRHAISDSIANGMRLAVESGEVAEIGIELQCVRDVLADPKPHIAELSIKLTKCIQARIALSERAIANEASA